MIIGLDIDGVIAPDPWLKYKKGSFKKFRVFGEISRIIYVLFYYLIRSPFPETKKLIRGYKRRGYKIIIISGVWGIGKPMIWLWFKLHRIPFDKLILKWKGSVWEFKAKAVLLNQCEMFVDDRLDVIFYVRKAVWHKGCWNSRITHWWMKPHAPCFYILTFTPFFLVDRVSSVGGAFNLTKYRSELINNFC